MDLIDGIKQESEMIHGFVDDTYNNCGRLNSCLSEYLSDKGIEHRFVRRGGSVETSEGSHRHEFLVIPSSEVGSDGDLIVDVAIDQFCDSYFESGEVSVTFGSREKLPKVGVFDKTIDYSEPKLPTDGSPHEHYRWS
jgi:hypothetical protein